MCEVNAGGLDDKLAACFTLHRNLTHRWELRHQPYIGLFKHILKHAVQLLPIAFAGIAIQAVRLHRLHPYFGIRENLVHSFRQLCQDNLSGPFEPLYIAFVINQFNEHKSLRKTTVVVYSFLL